MSSRPRIFSMSTRTRTLDATRFTFWPPGPDERVKEMLGASSGMVISGVTAIGWCVPST